ncbi:MAG TPA: iron ABC transporter permease, partial [Spirochaetia bacterium]|nr:iron ABC transporter permease [Spirochaetia bacterium]
KRPAVVFAVLSALLILSVVLAVCVGAVPIRLLEVLRLGARSLGLQAVRAPDATAAVIISQLRLPRVIAALLVGSALAACGVVMQGLFRNPMASPEILGVSAGGSVGAVVAITTGAAAASQLLLPFFTIAGAFVSTALIYSLSSSRGTTSLFFIILAGMAISALCGGITSGLLLFARQYEVSQYVFWTMGGLDGRTWQHVLYSAPVLIPGVAVLSLFSRELNVFSFGEEGAHSLGVPVEGVKRLLLAVSAVVTGVAISVSGPVGFIGLLVPHLLRMILGPDHRRLMPAAALGGGMFLVACDLVGRAVAPPFEIRVGIITAIIGSPYLLSLVLRTQRRST